MHKGNERTIDIPGFTIAALEWGPEDGIPVLALHGWLDNAASFSFLAPLLTGAHVIAVDSPGCGLSSHKAQGTIPSVLDEAFVVIQIAKALAWEKFVLLAHSRGAAVAQLVAAGCPDGIDALILIDNVGLHPLPVLDSWQHAMKAVLNNRARPATLFKSLEDCIRGRMQAGALTFESAKALTERGARAQEGGFTWTFDRRESMFVVAMPLVEEQIIALLGGIKAPTCVILGDKGLWGHSTEVQRWASLITDHELHSTPGHHHLHMDNPQPVAKIINDFLRRKT